MALKGLESGNPSVLAPEGAAAAVRSMPLAPHGPRHVGPGVPPQAARSLPGTYVFEIKASQA